MVVAFTISEINFSGKPILRCDAAPFLFIFAVIKFFGCSISFVSGIATEAPMPSQKSFTIF